MYEMKELRGIEAIIKVIKCPEKVDSSSPDQFDCLWRDNFIQKFFDLGPWDQITRDASYVATKQLWAWKVVFVRLCQSGILRVYYYNTSGSVRIWLGTRISATPIKTMWVHTKVHVNDFSNHKLLSYSFYWFHEFKVSLIDCCVSGLHSSVARALVL